VGFTPSPPFGGWAKPAGLLPSPNTYMYMGEGSILPSAANGYIYYLGKQRAMKSAMAAGSSRSSHGMPSSSGSSLAMAR